MCFNLKNAYFIIKENIHAPILQKNLKNKINYSIILNSKITGEKYRIKEVDQSEVYDLKPLVEDNIGGAIKTEIYSARLTS